MLRVFNLSLPQWRRACLWVCLVLGGGFVSPVAAQPEAEGPADPEAPARPEIKPLQDLFRGLFNGPQPPARPPARNRGRPAVPPQAEEGTSQRLDVNLNSDAQGLRILTQVDTFIAREKWHDVVTTLQSLVDGADGRGDTFTRDAAGNWISLERLAVERLATLPAAGVRLYQQVYAPVAEDLLSQARQAGDLARLVEVARRFLLTPAGQLAAVDVMMVHFDRGEFRGAVRWFDRLSVTTRQGLSPLVRLKVALALHESGREADAERVYADLRRLDADVVSPPAGFASLAEWWARLPRAVSRPEPQNDWPLMYGNAAGAGVAHCTEPLLLEQWSLPMTHVHAVREQIAALMSDLRDAGRACIPATFAIVVDGRLAVRTLRGVEVLDLASGKTLWSEPFDETAPERLLSGRATTTGEVAGLQRNLISQAQYSEAGDFDQHPLTNLLFRDQVNGTLSSDGRQLFAIAHHAVLGRSNYGYWWGQQVQERDPFDRDWSTNMIVSYDLVTGAERWKIGGPRMDEPFDPPLAGAFFFGPPTPAEDELYVIGERDNEICLFVLEASTGRPVYTQPLANATARIDVDMARRLWSCSPAVAEGVVVCPTTTGWVVAVDRREQRLLWASPLATMDLDTNRRQVGGVMVQPIHPLNVRWATAPPIISGGRVILTPDELPDIQHSRLPIIACLDLATGRELWRHDKEDDGLFVAGVFKDRVLTVGRGRLRCVSLEDGRALWNTTLPVDGPPSGRGVACEDRYLLPLANGELWVVNLQDGAATARLELPDAQLSLGNLVVSDGRLVSIDPQSVRCFTEQATLEAEIARRQGTDPDDLWAMFRQAQLQRMRGDREAAVRILRRVEHLPVREQDDPELRESCRRLLKECLIALVSRDLRLRDEEFAELQRLADPRTNEEVRRLTIDRALARSEWSAAWQHLWPPTSGPAALEWISDGSLQVRRESWEAGRLADLYQSAPDPLRAEMDAAASEFVDRCIEKTATPELRRAGETALQFHPAGRRLTTWLAEQAEQDGPFADAELRWRRLFESGTGAEACQTGLRLASWLARHGQTADAQRLLADVDARITALQTAASDAVTNGPEAAGDASRDADDRQALRTEFAAVCERLQLTPSRQPMVRADWTDTEFEAAPARRQQQQQQPPQDVVVFPAREAFYESHRFEFLPQTQRLRIAAAGSDAVWSVPLRSPTRAQRNFDPSVGLRTSGLQGYVIWQGVVQALSFPEKRVRWTCPIDLQMSGGNYLRNVQRNVETALQPAERFTSFWGLRRFRSSTGMIAAASADYVALYGRREITVLDALTGEVRWTRGGVAPQTMVYGDEQQIYLFPVDGGGPLVLRAADGRELARPAIASHAARSIALNRGTLVVLNPGSGMRLFGLLSPRMQLVGIDVATGATQWQYDVDPQALLGWLDVDQLGLLAPTGEFRALDVSTGSMTKLGRVPGDVFDQHGAVQLASDPQFAFLILDRPRSRHVTYLNAPTARVDGAIVCFDRFGQGLLWQQAVTQQHLLLLQFEQSPVLTFINQVSQDALFSIRIELWDKRTGRSLLEAKDLLTQSQFYQFAFDLDDRKLRLQTHNLEIEVRPRTSPSPPAAEPAVEAKPEAGSEGR